MTTQSERDALLLFGVDTTYTDAPADPDSAAKKKQPPVATKKEFLPKNPLEKVDEDIDREKKEARSGFHGCADYFGVKSYLHHFYDQHVYKDPRVYEDEDDFRYLLHPNPRKRRCTSIWWKVFVWIGANFLVFGIIGVLVGYLVPQRTIIANVDAITKVTEIDRDAISYNFNLDVCKLVGLILFCIGGLTLTVALLFPSFLYQYCDDGGRDGPFKVRIGEEQPLKSPLEMTIPATPQISNVQPERRYDESIVTKEGMVAMQE